MLVRFPSLLFHIKSSWWEQTKENNDRLQVAADLQLEYL